MNELKFSADYPLNYSCRRGGEANLSITNVAHAHTHMAVVEFGALRQLN